MSEYDDSEMSFKSDFVMEKLKGGDNFNDWIFQMENYLAMQGYSDCITPRSDTELTIAKENDVTKLNAAKGILVLSMESCLHPHIRKCTSALLIWTKIQELFEDRGHLRRTSLLEKLVTNKLKNCESMTVYIANVMTTVAKLENIGLVVGDEWVIAFLLVGLSEKFESFIMSLGANTQLKSDELKLKLLEMDDKECDEAMLAKKNMPNKNKKKNFKKQRRCYACNSTSHLRNSEECPNRNKQETQTANAKTSGNANNAFCALQVIGVKGPQSDWYVDSGATSHMTPYGNILSDKEEIEIGHIVTANHEKIAVKYHGTALFQSNKSKIEMKKILHVPDLAVNLLSVSKMVDNSNSVTFNKAGCTIKNEKDEILASCKSTNGVYLLELRNVCILAQSPHTAMNWHRRLGHVNFQTLQKMKNNPIYGIAYEDDDHEIKNCIVCAKGKRARTPFSKSGTTTKRVLDLVHLNLAGPMENISYCGTRYMMIFEDDFSRMVFLYFLKHKSEAFEKFKEFKSLVENQTGEKIKIIRTDNGGEYVSNYFENFCKANGLIHQLTAPHTPQQNVIVARMNRTIIEKARCLLFDADLSKRAWAEACNMAAYIRNRTPSSSIAFKAPLEIWSGGQINLKLMKLFGSEVMVHVPAAQTNKWSSKSTKMTFVGYDTRTKAYRCLNPETHKVIVSRDVIFHENSSSGMQIEIDEPTKDDPDRECAVEGSTSN